MNKTLQRLRGEKGQTILLLSIITIFGLVLRYQNQYPYLIYPDAYQNLLVAKNIREFGGVMGTLGEGGLLYPPFFSWSRVGYSVLLNIFGLVSGSNPEAIKLVSLLTGGMAIIIAYFLGKEFWQNRASGIIAALLMAISFNHVVWGGFALTESTAILLQLIFLWLLIKKDKERGLVPNFLTGGVFSLAVFTRYEYLFLLVPAVIILKARKETNRIKAILLGMTLVSSAILLRFYPLKETIIAGWSEVFGVNLSARIGVILMMLLIGVLIATLRFRDRVNRHVWDKGGKLILLCGYGTVGMVFVLGAVNRIVGINTFGIKLGGLTGFIYTDFLIVITFVVSCYQAIIEGCRKENWIFLLAGIIGLGAIYAKLNPDMQRYGTHLLPLMMMGASYEGVIIGRYTTRRIILASLCLLIMFQVTITYKGIRSWEGGVWNQESYEQVAAKKVAKILSKDVVLIAAFPETYYFYSGNTTLSQTNFFSASFLIGFNDDRPVAIVSDMGTREMFPDFFAFLNNNMEEFRSNEFYTDKDLFIGARRLKEERPVEVYITNVAILRQKLSR